MFTFCGVGEPISPKEVGLVIHCSLQVFGQTHGMFGPTESLLFKDPAPTAPAARGCRTPTSDIVGFNKNEAFDDWNTLFHDLFGTVIGLRTDGRPRGRPRVHPWLDRQSSIVLWQCLAGDAHRSVFGTPTAP